LFVTFPFVRSFPLLVYIDLYATSILLYVLPHSPYRYKRAVLPNDRFLIIFVIVGGNRVLGCTLIISTQWAPNAYMGGLSIATALSLHYNFFFLYLIVINNERNTGKRFVLHDCSFRFYI
jgi:hypothetical protein